MRRLAAAEVLAVAASAGFAGTRSFAFVATPAVWAQGNVGIRRPVQLARPAPQPKAQQGGGDEDEAYREDDQRRFWDTVVEVLTQELGTEDDRLSRVWEFVRHNRDSDDAPAESPSYRATGLYFPGLEAKPWWDRSEFPWLRDLEAAAPDITLEMEALARAGGGAPYKGGSGEMSTVYDATQGWGTMRLRYMGRFGQPGINYSLLPRTLSALRRLPLAPETAAFQRQLPKTGLPLHVDPSNFVLGCHLGVVVPSPDGLTASSTSRRGGRGALGDDRRRSKKRRGRTSGTGANGGGGGGGGFGFGGGGPGPAAGRGEEGAVKGGGGRSSAAAREAGGAAHGREGGGGDGSIESAVSRDISSSGADDRNTEGGGGGGGGVEEVLADKAGGRITAAAAAAVDAEEEGPRHRLPSGGGVGGGIVGERAWIEVSGEKRHWQTGQAFVFDPSFLHRTHNPTAGERVILNVDVWHPGLEEVEKTAIRRVCEMVEQWNARTGLFA